MEWLVKLKPEIRAKGRGLPVLYVPVPRPVQLWTADPAEVARDEGPEIIAYERDPRDPELYHLPEPWRTLREQEIARQDRAVAEQDKIVAQRLVDLLFRLIARRMEN